MRALRSGSGGESRKKEVMCAGFDKLEFCVFLDLYHGYPSCNEHFEDSLNACAVCLIVRRLFLREQHSFTGPSLRRAYPSSPPLWPPHRHVSQQVPYDVELLIPDAFRP